jgi:hypothetical protein
MNNLLILQERAALGAACPLLRMWHGGEGHLRVIRAVAEKWRSKPDTALRDPLTARHDQRPRFSIWPSDVLVSRRPRRPQGPPRPACLGPSQAFQAFAVASPNKVLVDYGGFVHMSAIRQPKSNSARNQGTAQPVVWRRLVHRRGAPTTRSESSCRYSFAKTMSIRLCGFSRRRCSVRASFGR